MMIYTPKKFYDSLPQWKRKKDNIFCKLIYRPLSCLLASFLSLFRLSANTVSYISLIVAIISCSLFTIDNFCARLAGAILINVWLVFDCADGNIARTIKKEPFGDFADSISSYVLIAFLWATFGLCVYYTGGLIVKSGNIYILLLGVLASISDPLMRLIYQKYRSMVVQYELNGFIKKQKDVIKDTNAVTGLIQKVNTILGIGGVIPLLILFSVIFNFGDLVIFYAAFYFFGSFLAMALLYIYKSIKLTKEISRNSNFYLENSLDSLNDAKEIIKKFEEDAKNCIESYSQQYISSIANVYYNRLLKIAENNPDLLLRLHEYFSANDDNIFSLKMYLSNEQISRLIK